VKYTHSIANVLFEFKQTVLSCARRLFALLFGGEHCLCCGSDSGSLPICKKCVEKELMQFLPPDGETTAPLARKRCSVCGKPLVSELEKCMDCRGEPILAHTDVVFPLYQYRLWRKELLFAWKIEGKRSLSPVFAAAMHKALCLLFPEEKPVIVPVPPRPGKIRSSGWDQIDELCMFLRHRYGYTVLPLLERTTSRQQKKLDRAGRLEMKGKSYVMSPLAAGVLLPGRVALIDDVLTTGVTVESCAALLKGAGVSKVTVLTLFIVD